MQEKVQAVQRMQDYIEKHCNDNITPMDLAKVSFFSPWYSARIFKELTNYSPAEYIRRLKLSKSALKLRDENCKIVDITFEMGFGSVDGYQRAFSREFGCNPHDYAKHPIPLHLFIAYGVKFKAIKEEKFTMEKVQNVFLQVINKPERKVLIKRGVKATDYFEYCDEVGCDIWGVLASMKSINGEPVCLWLPKEYIKPGTSEYVQGIEVSTDYDGEIPDGFDVILLPKAKYLMFQGEPFMEEDYIKAITAVQESMTKYDLKTMGLERDYSNPRIQLEPKGERGYIEMIAVK